MGKMVTLRTLNSEGDSARKVTVKTLVAEKILDMPLHTIINGKAVKNWDELLEEIQTTENPQILQVPEVKGG